jgi:hypothetical protein
LLACEHCGCWRNLKTLRQSADSTTKNNNNKKIKPKKKKEKKKAATAAALLAQKQSVNYARLSDKTIDKM